MIKKFYTSLLGIWVISLALAGCNMPTSSTPTDAVPPDAVFTAAAETIVAKISPTSPGVQPDQPEATDTPSLLPPTQTPVPTVTSTPTNVPTPTEIPQVIYFDDFSDQTSWYAYEDDRYGFRYTDDGYQIYSDIVNGVIWSIREQSFAHVALEVDGTRISGPEDSYFGVVCNLSDEGENYYALVIGDNGFYGLLLRENGEDEFLNSGVDEANIIKRGQNQTNRIRGVCNGGHFMIYANGELLLDTWDDALDEGIIGLAIGKKGTSGRVEFRFNDFAVTYP